MLMLIYDSATPFSTYTLDEFYKFISDDFAICF